MTVAIVVAGFTILWSFWLFGAAITAIYKRYRMQKQQLDPRSVDLSKGSILVLRPCAGIEADLLDCLLSIKDAKCSRDIELVFGVSDPDDPALPVIRQAIEALRDTRICIRFEIAPIIGPNRKVSILAACAKNNLKQHEFVISADSNADLTGFDLDALCDALMRQSSPGSIWAPFTVHTVHGKFGNRLLEAVLHGSWQSFAFLSALDPKGLVGKLFAIRPGALQSIGGFGVLADYLGEDMELSRRLVSKGFDVSPHLRVAKSRSGPTSVAESMDRLQRWTMVIKAQRSKLLFAYPAMFGASPLIFALSLLNALPSGYWSLVALGIALGGRMMVGIAARRYCGLPAPFWTVLTDILLADIGLLIVFCRVLRTKNVIWRGVAFKLDPRGKLIRD